MAEGNIRLGKVAFVDKGTYSSATTYNTFDFITTMIVAISVSRTGTKDTL